MATRPRKLAEPQGFEIGTGARERDPPESDANQRLRLVMKGSAVRIRSAALLKAWGTEGFLCRATGTGGVISPVCPEPCPGMKLRLGHAGRAKRPRLPPRAEERRPVVREVSAVPEFVSSTRIGADMLWVLTTPPQGARKSWSPAGRHREHHRQREAGPYASHMVFELAYPPSRTS